MTFDQFLENLWNAHVADPRSAIDRIPEAIALISNNDQIPPLVQLVTHLCGEHTGQWQTGISLLRVLYKHKNFIPETTSESSLACAIAALELASGQRTEVGDFPRSDQIRIFAVAAAALVEQSQTDRAATFFAIALQKAEGIDRGDPANKALAITGNNIACHLEEKSQRSPLERELMLLAAEASRKYWGIAGDWLHLERAEYRLATSKLSAGDPAAALVHAQNCLAICQNHQAGPFEIYFAYEVLALVERTLGNHDNFVTHLKNAELCYSRLDREQQRVCEKSLLQIKPLS